ncbi:MAG: hypothetical protein HGA61_00955 [Candidatus Moranbacteria bacterium]|nr:hypothetical protein [Candidatus Moranbacteria bacterium]
MSQIKLGEYSQKVREIIATGKYAPAPEDCGFGEACSEDLDLMPLDQELRKFKGMTAVEKALYTIGDKKAKEFLSALCLKRLKEDFPEKDLLGFAIGEDYMLYAVCSVDVEWLLP